MKKSLAMAGCTLLALWALYSVALGESGIKSAGKMIIPVTDSGIFDSICYQESSGTLTLIFRTGYGYEYSDVPRNCYEGLLYTVRKGEYFNFNIRGKFPCRRIDAGQDIAALSSE